MPQLLIVRAFITGLTLAVAPVLAGGHHHHRGHHHHHPRHVHSGVSIGVGIGGYWPGHAWPGRYGAYPAWGWAPVPVERPRREERPADPPPAAPDPVFVPQQGQSAVRTEGDWRDCTRATMTQADAMQDAQLFHRRTLACMASRGYTVE